MGINATDLWDTCYDTAPSQIYWLNYDGNWQEVDRKPEKFLKRLRKNMRAELRGTPSEAYILTSLGQVEERLGKFQSSIKRFEQAWPMLRDSNDPHNQKSSVLAPLFLHYIQPKRDQEKGQAYLNEYAIVVTANSTEKTEYLPIARVTPIYPRSAQKRGLEGYVEMEFTVTAEGRVKNPVITRASPKGVFEQAALKAAENFLYVPKVIDGKRVAVEGVTNKITFEINR